MAQDRGSTGASVSASQGIAGSNRSCTTVQFDEACRQVVQHPRVHWTKEAAALRHRLARVSREGSSLCLRLTLNLHKRALSCPWFCASELCSDQLVQPCAGCLARWVMPRGCKQTWVWRSERRRPCTAGTDGRLRDRILGSAVRDMFQSSQVGRARDCRDKSAPVWELTGQLSKSGHDMPIFEHEAECQRTFGLSYANLRSHACLDRSRWVSDNFAR
jgi:hypothetical protein